MKRLKIGSITVLLLLFSYTTVRLSQAALSGSCTIATHGDVIDPEQGEGTFGSEDILFEFGAESGVLVPPWDAATCMSGSCMDSYVGIEETHARTGTKSVELYQCPPPKNYPSGSNYPDRRVELRWYDTPKDVYVSWWCYFDSRWNTQDDEDSWGTCLGGAQAWWGPDGDFSGGWTAIRWYIHPTTREIYAKYWFSDFGSGTPYGTDEDKYYYFSPKKYITDYIGQWVHFQVHLKLSTTNTGEYQAWFNNELIGSDSGLKTDPEGYSAWGSKDFEWARGQHGGPWVVIENYQDWNSFESWYWVDDVVAATEKIPEHYGVE